MTGMVEPVGNGCANQRPDAVRTAILSRDSTAIGSMSVAVTGKRQSFAAAIASTPLAAAEIEHHHAATRGAPTATTLLSTAPSSRDARCRKPAPPRCESEWTPCGTFSGVNARRRGKPPRAHAMKPNLALANPIPIGQRSNRDGSPTNREAKPHPALESYSASTVASGRTDLPDQHACSVGGASSNSANDIGRPFLRRGNRRFPQRRRF